MVNIGKNTQKLSVNEVEEPKRARSGSFNALKAKVLRPFNTSEVKILLLENVNETAVKAFIKEGYQVKMMQSSHLEYTPDSTFFF